MYEQNALPFFVACVSFCKFIFVTCLVQYAKTLYNNYSNIIKLDSTISVLCMPIYYYSCIISNSLLLFSVLFLSVANASPTNSITIFVHSLSVHIYLSRFELQKKQHINYAIIFMIVHAVVCALHAP